jgi:Methylamine utilisation protein MauE
MMDPVVQLIGRGALALLFGWSAAHKLRDVDAFRAALEGYDLLPPLWAVPAGAVLIGSEVGLATGLLLPPVAPVAALGGAALLVLYAGAMAVNLRRGRRDIDCGCGGPAGRQPISAALVGRNIVLAMAAIGSALPAHSRSLTWVDGATIVLAVLTVSLLYAAIDGLLRNARDYSPQRDAEGGRGAGHNLLAPLRSSAVNQSQ